MITTKPIHLKILKETSKYTLFVDENPVYTIKPKCIQCKKCGKISYNTEDIAREFCGNCKKYFAEIDTEA
jgi:hypothetical protein